MPVVSRAEASLAPRLHERIGTERQDVNFGTFARRKPSTSFRAKIPDHDRQKAVNKLAAPGKSGDLEHGRRAGERQRTQPTSYPILGREDDHSKAFRKGLRTHVFECTTTFADRFHPAHRVHDRQDALRDRVPGVDGEGRGGRSAQGRDVQEKSHRACQN
eukprot:6204238-Pleurochrysis_carterae.AAC.2